jgi:hypothetical protein
VQDLNFINNYQRAWTNLSRQEADKYQTMGETHGPAQFRSGSEDSLFRRAEVVVEKYGAELLRNFPVATAVAVSLKYAGGEVRPGEPCITFFVGRKRPIDELENRVIPREIEGVLTDVVEAGVPRISNTAGAPHVPGTRLRPAPPGSSIAHSRVSSGTFGCLVTDGNSVYILSCAHVLSDVAATAGDHILQPGSLFGGTTPLDHIASFVRAVPLFSGFCIADAAIARVHNSGDVTPDVLQIGKPSGTRVLTRVGRSVQKSGNQTGVTSGTVVGIKARVGPLSINGAANIYFSDVIITTGMSDSGDSGALLMDNGRRALGILFGGLAIGSTYAVSWYNPIDAILSNLGVTLVT